MIRCHSRRPVLDVDVASSLIALSRIEETVLATGLPFARIVLHFHGCR